jgi:hypothetical protein
MRRLAGVGPDESVPTAYYKEAVAVGRIAYDEELAAKCLEYVRTRGCEYSDYHVLSEEERAGQLACIGLFEGRMGKNGPCLSALECAEDSVCGFDPTCVDMCCVGACRVLPAPLELGEPCAGNRPCAAETFCASDPDTGMPTVCTASPTAGQPCPQFDCAGGATCEFNGGDSPVCVAPKPEGGACELTTGSARAAWPASATRTTTTGCACCPPRRVRAATGSRRIRCVGASTTRATRRPPAARRCPATGEFCADYRCLGDLFCSEITQRCTPVADPGEGCGYSNIDYTYTPCSGDSVCENEFDVGSCATPNPASPCPVPEDPLAGG